MKRFVWQMLPLLLLTFFYFLAISTAEDVQRASVADQQFVQDSQHTSKSAHWEVAAAQKGSDGGEQERAESVREATNILRKVKPPAVSKLARYTRRPKGFLGSAVYYSKEAFFLLFMNAPKQANLLTTSTSQSKPKLAQPLSKAVKLLEDAADENNADAIYLLAEMNFYGNFSHPVNYEEAFERYRQLADLDGNSTAQYMLGFMYATGLNPAVPVDQAKSILYHTFAAEQGQTRSEMTLAYRHHAGIATAKNCDEAVHWYKKVADKAIDYYRSGPPGGHVLVRDAFRLADENGGIYGEGASVSSAGIHAKQGGPTSDAYASIEDVLEYLYLQSSKGDLKATFGLARLHYDGSRGLKRDLKLAKKYFKSIARLYWTDTGKVLKDVAPGTEKLATKAAGYLGRMFLRGEGMEQSYSKARIWFTRGLSNGDALSQYSLGLMHLRGLGVPEDVGKAADYFAAAADQDLAVAQTNLGMLFLDQGDTRTATQYFELAARNSHIEAFYYLAELNNKAIGRDRSCGMAAVYYKIVAEKAEPVWGALNEANEAYEEGDNQKAIIRYLMAAEQGSENSQSNVAWLLDHTKPRWSPIAWLSSLQQSAKFTIGDAAVALIYWTRSAKQNNFDSLVKMGDYYLSGIGTAISPENAAACYQAAAETMQSAQAMWNLGWLHENGIGIEQDFHLAKRFYDQALETNKEAYLPVKMSLWKLRWRSWWNGVTRGGVHGIEEDEPERKKRSFAEWLQDFLEADAAYYDQYVEADDWDAQHDPMPGGDQYWGDDDIDDDILDALLIGGLIAALAWLVYYRQQQQRAAEQRRRQQEEGQQGQAGAQDQQQQQQQPPPLPGQQPDGGFFPQPGDPNWNAWAAGAVGH
ncbi:ERAD-associated protein [Vermiconidia calcicola]|uniref:ERAD-associated protein n=1 Tax=Vermiconidia calcicola TaxID=1690605 RepID=A0ACC3M978_9PEZI|nr:ERAD-associated protein [Vermiconidia calcicola]